MLDLDEFADAAGHKELPVLVAIDGGSAVGNGFSMSSLTTIPGPSR